MEKRKFTTEQIISKLREAEVLQSQCQTIAMICKKLMITEQTYYRWRKEYGGKRIDQAKKMKALEEKNKRLKKIVADLSLVYFPRLNIPPSELLYIIYSVLIFHNPK